MAKINQTAVDKRPVTHEGAKAYIIGAEATLRRTLMSCMLWESNFYEDGQSVADRIAENTLLVPPAVAVSLAIEARNKMKLRHAPLLVARTLAGGNKEQRAVVANLLPEIIQRPDELTEFLAIYWKDKKQPLSAGVKKGLAKAFRKFNAYSLAKYNRKETVKLKDVLFLTHPKPKDEEQAQTWKQLVDDTLAVPDTWEVALSSGADKKVTWERLLSEGKLGALALLRNLRNMNEVGVSRDLIKQALLAVNTEKVLPFRFIAAARYAPELEPEIEATMVRALTEHSRLKGKTVLLVDHSGSMQDRLSSKSDMTRFDAACGLAILLREICEDVSVVSFSGDAILVPARRGFALRDAIDGAQGWGSTNTENGKARADSLGYDRLIIITDEQSHQTLSAPLGKGYVINVATYKNGIGYGKWTHIDGWSEAVVDYIQTLED